MGIPLDNQVNASVAPPHAIGVHGFDYEAENNSEVKIENGRYIVFEPDDLATKIRLTRMTRVTATLDDDKLVNDWRMRMGLKGMAISPELVAYAAALDVKEDRSELNDIAERVIDRAGGSVGRDLGSAVHKFTEYVDNGGDLEHIPEEFRRHVVVYQQALREFGLTVLHVEQMVALTQFKLAGTFDRVVANSDGEKCILDVKTSASMQYSQLSFSIQMAGYAIHDRTIGPGGVLGPKIEGLSQDVAYLVHVPSRVDGPAEAHVYECRLGDGPNGEPGGHANFILAAEVRETRLAAKRKTNPLMRLAHSTVDDGTGEQNPAPVALEPVPVAPKPIDMEKVAADVAAEREAPQVVTTEGPPPIPPVTRITKEEAAAADARLDELLNGHGIGHTPVPPEEQDGLMSAIVSTKLIKPLPSTTPSESGPMPENHLDIPEPFESKIEELRYRFGELIKLDQKDALVHIWKAQQVPRIRNEQHTDDELLRIEAAISAIEGMVEAPFVPPHQPEPVVLGGGRLEALPLDLRAWVRLEAERLEPLHSMADLEVLVERRIESAERTLLGRQIRVNAAMVPVNVDARNQILDKVRIKRDKVSQVWDLSGLQQYQVEEIVALCAAVEHGLLDPDLNPLQLDVLGGRASTLKAGKVQAKRHNQPLPRKAEAVTQNPMVYALAWWFHQEET